MTWWFLLFVQYLATCNKQLLSSFIIIFAILNWPQVFVTCNLALIITLIDTVSNLVFWSRFANKLEPWPNVYIIQH